MSKEDESTRLCGIDAIENLILSDKVCNNDKRDLLASPSLVRRWTERNRTHYDLLRESAIQTGWETDLSGTVGVARAIYGHLPPGDRPFWGGRGSIVLADAGDALLILQAALIARGEAAVRLNPTHHRRAHGRTSTGLVNIRRRAGAGAAELRAIAGRGMAPACGGMSARGAIAVRPRRRSTRIREERWAIWRSASGE
jgi:hypothetical protein